MSGEEEIQRPPLQLPERIFAVGEEPRGVRVTPYHKASGISDILKALDPEEVENIRGSPFGKLVEIAEKPSFSGRFGRYIISRQLRVSKKHEAWFIFAGKPIRFSLREFALVTGLNCGRFPKPSKKRSKRYILEKPYYGELFGTIKEVPVSTVIKMLRMRIVVDAQIRLKYAYLALLASVILPTTHTPRISTHHAEMIKDLNSFLAYPWGRLSFDMLMTSIKERKEVSLAQKTIALKGFVLAMQLVMVESVPALTEVVQDGSSSEEEGGFDADGDQVLAEKVVLKSISPGHARDIDAGGKALVQSILLDDTGGITTTSEYGWSDDEEDDVVVSNMVKLIEQGFSFPSSCFVGGSSRQDVIRMREESKAQMLNRKAGKQKTSNTSETLDGVDVDLLACVVREKVKQDLVVLQSNISTLQQSFIDFKTSVISSLENNALKLEALSSHIQNLPPMVPEHPGERSNRPTVDVTGTEGGEDGTANIISKAMDFANGAIVNAASGTIDGQNNNAALPQSVPSTRPQESPPPASLTDPDLSLDPGLLFPNPTFSLGMTQEGRDLRGKEHGVTTNGDKDAVGEDNVDGVEEDIDDEEIVADTEQQDVDVNESVEVGEDDNVCGCENKDGDEDDEEPDFEETLVSLRKSKRPKLPTKSLLAEYQCDQGFLNRARNAVGVAMYKGGNIDYAAKFAVLLDKMKTKFCVPTERGSIQSNELKQMVERSTQLSTKVVDILIFHIGTLHRSVPSWDQPGSCVFMDTQLVSQLMKLYTKFSKVSKKESFKFSATVVQMIQKDPFFTFGGRVYFPFNLDQKFWVGICVDCTSWVVTVLDCNTTLRSDNMMNKEVKPIAQMFPYLLKQSGKNLSLKECKAMVIERPRTIPQQHSITDSAVATLLLIQAHASGGIDLCKCITPDVLASEVERLSVSLYETYIAPL